MKSGKLIDVAILGSGTASLSAAIFLAQAGLRALILARVGRPPKRIGESLPPQANPVLRQLGVWSALATDGHLPCYGNQSAWGSADLKHEDFIRHPHGHGWQLDREQFEQRLVERARTLGVAFVHSQGTVRASRDQEHWTLEAGPELRPARARFLLDATGRERWLARQQGAHFLREDRQVALVTYLKSSVTRLEDATGLVESTRDGWWYSALLPGQRLTMVFMTDVDLHPRPRLTTVEGWTELALQAPLTAARVSANAYRLVAPPRLVAAESGRLDRLWADGWATVGDAAMTLDPLSSHGLTVAMLSGRDFAQAVAQHFGGDREALSSYGTRLTVAFSQYETIRLTNYRAERRWLNSTYWQRRQRVEKTVRSQLLDRAKGVCDRGMG
jgi:flavin-dependent dehydrogenase